MVEWLATTLGQVVTFQRGFDITRKDQRPGVVPVISSGGTSSFHDRAAAKGPGVIIGRKGTLGTVFFTDQDYWPHDTTLWVKDFKSNYPRFVYYFMRQLDVSWLDAGSANPTLNRNHLHPLGVMWPPVTEQRAIAEVLGALDDKIAVNTRLVATADALAKSLTKLELRDAATVRLRDRALVTMGSSPPGSALNEGGDGTAFYQGVRDFGTRFPGERVWTTAPLRMAAPLDTLLSVRAPVGRTNLAREASCIGRGLASIRSIDQTPYALFHILRANSQVWASYEAEGTVFGSINSGQLNELELSYPAEGPTSRLEAALLPIEERIAAALQESLLLGSARDALLPALMSGKLRVKEAERAVEELV